MRLLILSDVHANLAALEAVLRSEPVFDQAVFLGDAVDYGPDPSACLERLAGLTTIRLRGNHDNAVASGVTCACSEAFRELSEASRAYTREALSAAELAALRALPTQATLTLAGSTFYLAHASPRDNLFEYVSPERDPERWREAIEPALAGTPGQAPADVVLLGHTHHPYVRVVRRPDERGSQAGRMVVNPGSVGQPRNGDPRAHYAVWEDGRVVIRRVWYDVQDTIARLGRTGLAPAVVERLGDILARGGLGG
jgi:putative phosphoesterase